jgi:Transcriptional regulator, AbiEi antitoxin, Type IV TA system
MARNRPTNSVARFLDELRAVPFVEGVSYGPPPGGENERFDGLLTIRTKQGTFRLAVQLKLSYLDRASTHAIVAFAATSKRKRYPLILFARYIPRPTGEQLVAGDLNFVDLAGNMHLALGPKYLRTLLGRPEPRNNRPKGPMTAAQVQLMFLFAAEPSAFMSSVREIATKAGVSKSKAAEVRKKLVEEYQIRVPSSGGRAWPPRDMEQLLLSGYIEVLRPKLFLGRFRSPEANSEAFIARAARDLDSLGVRLSATGGPAAQLLQRFYRGPETPLFLSDWNPEIQKRLRLLPDRNGPITVLRAFGQPVFWRDVENLSVAHPWLIYAELMSSEDPRAHEAAEELRREFLPS